MELRAWFPLDERDLWGDLTAARRTTNQGVHHEESNSCQCSLRHKPTPGPLPKTGAPLAVHPGAGPGSATGGLPRGHWERLVHAYHEIVIMVVAGGN